jgi:UDP-N-acetylglucosamine diphosphorylase / glucose-1-phosphate thymidylyltransferase / UDP-N-acetylgalactosamine diphosphorylase / glucosamine-1-phosphate N-acetyltransferase / galactosamine-1-phosphate N-acetyltransferase
MKAVFFAAGKSTRTYPLTLTRPKPLLPVANKPIAIHQLEALPESVTEVILVVGYKHEMIREALGDAYNGVSIRYVMQEEQKGTGHALLQCESVIDEPFMAFNGDDIYHTDDIAELAKLEEGALCKTVEDPSRFGVFVLNDQGNVTQVIEKPAEPISNLANIGAYKFNPSIFEILRNTPVSPRGEIEITSAMETLAQQEVFIAHAITGHWLSVGYPWDLLGVNTELLKNLKEDIQGEVSPAAHLTGAVAIGRGTVIRPGVVIDGPAIIGENCTIGPNAWIRPNSSIGDGCKIGQGSEIKGSILMNNAKVPHLSYAGDSVLGEGVNMGCGTVTANFRHDGKNHSSMVKGELIGTGRRKLGAILADDVHTGINTAIYPGRKMWPHTSTLPGEVVQRDIES